MLLAKVELHPKKASGAAASISARMSLDFTEWDRARLARDPTYDGLFYIDVHTTGLMSTPRASTAVRSVRCAPPGRRTFRSSRLPPVSALSARNCSLFQRLDRGRTTVEQAMRVRTPVPSPIENHRGQNAAET